MAESELKLEPNVSQVMPMSPLKPDKKGRYIDFGILMIHREMLYLDGILLLKYIKSMAPVAKLKQQPISAKLQNLLIHIIEEQNIDDKMHDELIYSDAMLMEQILRRSKTIAQLKYRRRRPNNMLLIDEVKNRLIILQGSINAGSESQEIESECQELLKKLYDLDGISQHDYVVLKSAFE